MKLCRVAAAKTITLPLILASGMGFLCLNFNLFSTTQQIWSQFYTHHGDLNIVHDLTQPACQIQRKKMKAQYRHITNLTMSDANTPPTEQYIQALMQVFEQNSLQQRMQQAEKLHPQPKYQFVSTSQKKSLKSLQKSQPDIVAETLEGLSQLLPFNNQMRLGSDSNQDIYLQLSASQNWTIDPQLKLATQQSYRYGLDHKNDFNTQLKLSHTQSKTASAYSQFNVTYSNHADEKFIWEQRSYQKYQFSKNQVLILGMYSSGDYDKAMSLNRWGPYLSWQQPIWRNWLYLQSDLNYYNDKQNTLQHRLGSRLGFELHF